MARPTQTRVTRGTDFAPTAQRAPSLGVFAPLNVRAAPSGAEQLSNALGLVSRVAVPEIEKRIERNAYDAAAAGKLDAALGKVDAKRAREDRAYDAGQRRGMVEKVTLDALTEWQQQYEQSDKAGVTEEQLVADFNDFMQERLGSLAADGDTAAWVYGRIAPAEAKLVAEHRAAQSAAYREDMLGTAGQMIRDDLANGKPIDIEAYKSVLIGAGFTRGEATAQYVDAIGALAVEHGDPSMLDAFIPNKWDDGQAGPRAVPALANKINQYRYYAEQGAEAKKDEAKALAKAQAEQAQISVMQLAAQGNIAGALKMLDDAVGGGAQIDAADYRALRGFIISERDDIREQFISPTRIADFRVRMLENPSQFTPQDALRFVQQNFPPGKDGLVQASQFMDDFTTLYRASQAAEANPKAKAYRTALTNRYKPEPYSAQSKIERYAAGVLAFDLTFAETNDPERANEEARKVFEGTTSVEEKPVGTALEDAKAFAAGKIDGSALIQKYPTPEKFREAHRKGLIDEATARRLQQLYLDPTGGLTYGRP